MAPRFKSLFPWSSSVPDSLPRGRSYEPPISSTDYQPQPQPQSQEPLHNERPRTAPQKAATWDSDQNSGRTRSGFSMKSPPAFLSGNRKNSVSSTRSRRNSIWSIRSTSETPPPIPDFPNLANLPALPQSPAVRSFTTSVSTLSPPLTPEPPKDPSHIAPKPYIDLLAAHSAIKPAQRSRPLIARNYGEDIADRNIANFGEKSSEKLYTTRPRPKHIQILVQGDDGMKNGETQQHDAPPSPSPQTTSIRSFTAARPGIAYPPRSDSLRSDHTASASSISGDERVIPSIVVHDRRGHTMSPLSSPVTSVFEDLPARTPSPRPAAASPTRAAPSPPASEPARQRSPSVATVRSTSQSKPVPPLPSSGTPSRQTSTSSSQPDMASISDSPRRRARSRLEAGGSTAPTAIASRDDHVFPTRSASGATNSTNYSSSNISFSTANGNRTPRTASPHSISTHTASTTSPGTASTHASRKRASSRNGSVSYSAFPSCAPRRLSDASSRPRSGSRRRDYRGSKGASDLSPMEGRENLADTDVRTTIAPAVQHEEVILQTENIRHEAVTIETHTHEFRHRILPVIKTEILPTKHYIPSEDGKSLVEIPESLVPEHSLTGKEAREWHVAPGSAACRPADLSPTEAAAPPVIGLAHGEPQNRSRRNSTKSVKGGKSKSHKSTSSRAKSLFEPVLASKKEYMTEAGHPRTDYVWHHPPVMKTNDDKTHPIYIGAGLGDLSTHAYSSDEEEDLAGARFGAEAPEGGLLYKDFDYEAPGLAKGHDYDDHYGTGDTSSLTNEMNKMRM